MLLICTTLQALLRELVESGKIKARCKWKHVYPLFSTDERYLNMLGNPGSNQLELFWDVVDGLDQKLDAKIDVVTEAFKGYRAEGVEGDTEAPGFAVGPETTEEQYQNVLKAVSNANVEALTSKDIPQHLCCCKHVPLLILIMNSLDCSYMILRFESRLRRNVKRRSGNDICRTIYDMH